MESLDLLRGWIMVIMALDHVRDFFHQDVLLYDPTDLSKTTTAVFMTRWITHFCAPAFSFLAGAGAFLSLSRGKTKGELSYFLVTRGLWLVLLELTVMQFFWLFRFNLTEFGGITLWALGWSMVALAALIHLPLWGVAAVGIVIIIGHNLLEGHARRRASSRVKANDLDRISAAAVDRPDGGWLCVWRDREARAGGAPQDDLLAGSSNDSGVRAAPRPEHLWQPAAVDAAGPRRGVHVSLVP
jgi:hypothetical protein